MPRLALLLSLVLGGSSLAVFGLALAFGPFQVIPLGLHPSAALSWDAGLCLLFFAQHSIMVRRGFRDRLARTVPPPYHAALYSIASGLALLALVLLWQHSGIGLYTVEGIPRLALRSLFLGAGAVFLWAIRALGSFDTFGVRPIRARLRGESESPALPLAIRGPYCFVRHPLYSVFLVLLWAAPDLTADRLLFNGLFSAWIVVGSVLEERDLVREFGDAYRDYQRRVPMLIPWPGRRAC
jgi:protein-S-isoprenylcysteine O-methyltransferase Ste14